jgi:hypothetical protein
MALAIMSRSSKVYQFYLITCREYVLFKLGMGCGFEIVCTEKNILGFKVSMDVIVRVHKGDSLEELARISLDSA